MEMTTEAQRIAIAEACGWLLDHINRSAMYYVPSRDCHVGDPLSDLNACREFEEVLNSPKYMQFHAFNNYAAMLCKMCKHEYNAIAATAPQRCEAFLKTIEKWVTT